MSWKTFHRPSDARVTQDRDDPTSTDAAPVSETLGAPTSRESFVDRIKAALAA